VSEPDKKDSCLVVAGETGRLVRECDSPGELSDQALSKSSRAWREQIKKTLRPGGFRRR
jgi:hypothetical protein